MKYFFTLCLLLAAGSLFALDGIFAGLGIEVNANTRTGAALGGGLSLGLDLNQQWSVGLKTTFSHNMDTVSTLEPAVLARMYLPLPLPGVFAQAELGTGILFEDSKGYPSFMGGLAAGWQIDLGTNWYIEPMLRAGYPFLWGACVTAGMRFQTGGVK